MEQQQSQRIAVTPATRWVPKPCGYALVKCFGTCSCLAAPLVYAPQDLRVLLSLVRHAMCKLSLSCMLLLIVLQGCMRAWLMLSLS